MPALARYLANRPPARPNPSERRWRVERRPAAAPADAPWAFVREAQGPEAAVLAEVATPAPGEFRPHDLVRAVRVDLGFRRTVFVRSDGRVGITRGGDAEVGLWVDDWREAANGEVLLGTLRLAGVDMGVLGGLAAEMVRRAARAVVPRHAALHAALAAPVDPVALSYHLGDGGEDLAEEPEGPGEALRAAGWALVGFLRQGHYLGDVAREAARAISYGADVDGDDDSIDARDEAAVAEHRAQADLVRDRVPLAAMLEALTEERAP